MHHAGSDAGLARAPDPLIEFRERHSRTSKPRFSMERNHEFWLRKLFENSEYVERLFVGRVLDLLDVDAAELFAPVIEALLPRVPPGDAGIPAAPDVVAAMHQRRLREQ